MCIEDHDDFDKFILSFDGLSIKHGNAFDKIHCFDGFIQYQRSQLMEGVLSAGRIAIATTDLNGNTNFSNSKEIEVIYKKLRRWLKKRCINSLVCFNEQFDNTTLQPVKTLWVAPSALDRCKNGKVKLKQFHSGFVVFKLA